MLQIVFLKMLAFSDCIIITLKFKGDHATNCIFLKSGHFPTYLVLVNI